ncbi:MAG: hypothetical protein ACI8TQ_000707 [Planctomycetota bacterium]|jgi:hypothetical protein
MNLRASLLFHLNLSYSSIEVENRIHVVERCYWPILRLLDNRPWLRICIEASGHTLERIAELDASWMMRLTEGMQAGQVELIGSGDTQLIGPLVPSVVNHWNQKLGIASYERLVGERPQTALVNEMAWSQGMIDHYLDAGYQTLLMEWNNARRSHPEWKDEWRFSLVSSSSPSEGSIDMLFIDAIAFQKFQRAAVGDIDANEYCDWVVEQESNQPRHLFLYASDAEVFNFRPGRYSSEPPLPESDANCEWSRIQVVLDELQERGLEFTTPSRYRSENLKDEPVSVKLSSFANPIPVKKQPKYNITRWALSGRDDVALNASCFARARELEAANSTNADDWQALCRAWQSDYRTHITRKRWLAIDPIADPFPPSSPTGSVLKRSEVEQKGRLISIRTDGIELDLDARRGLAIRRLSGAGGATVLGTLPHGFFDDIHWAADFYSGHLVTEVPATVRITDLVSVEPTLNRLEDHIEVSATIDTELGAIDKRLRVYSDRVELFFGLSAWNKRPVGSLRAGFVTLDPETFGKGETWLTCAHGGLPERFLAEGDCDQWEAVSSLISARGAYGATDGRLNISNGSNAIELSWDPAAAAALPLVLRHEIDGRALLRVGFSLSEIDDTYREGAKLADFSLTLRPVSGTDA